MCTDDATGTRGSNRCKLPPAKLRERNASILTFNELKNIQGNVGFSRRSDVAATLEALLWFWWGPHLRLRPPSWWIPPVPPHLCLVDSGPPAGYKTDRCSTRLACVAFVCLHECDTSARLLVFGSLRPLFLLCPLSHARITGVGGLAQEAIGTKKKIQWHSGDWY